MERLREKQDYKEGISNDSSEVTGGKGDTDITRSIIKEEREGTTNETCGMDGKGKVR